MLYFLWKTYWRLTGWTIVGKTPYHLKKAVLLVGPHSSWKDLLVGIAARTVLRFEHTKFLGKKESLIGPLSLFLRWMKRTPIDLVAKKAITKQSVLLFNTQHELHLALSNEGTRKRLERLRTGFYFIAKHAEVPIIMVGLDFENRQMIISEPFYVTDDQEKDFDQILSFYSSIKGPSMEYCLQPFSVSMSQPLKKSPAVPRWHRAFPFFFRTSQDG